jgi:hypothetical protein
MFSAAEQDALAKIVITGSGRVGSNVYLVPEGAGFIERDMVGYYKINKVFQKQLEEWVKGRPIPRD